MGGSHLISCKPDGRKGTISELSNNLVTVSCKHIPKMDGMEFARAIILDPLRWSHDLVKSVLIGMGLLVAIQMEWRYEKPWTCLRNFCLC